jgi:hypothetical protein
MTGRALVISKRAAGRLIRFPMRRASCVWIIEDAEDAPWLSWREIMAGRTAKERALK